MMTSSNGNIFRVTGHLCGKFTGPRWIPAQRPVTRSFDVFFDLRLNKRLSKQPWGWWFETPAWSLWRHRNALLVKRGPGFSWCEKFLDYAASSVYTGREIKIHRIYMSGKVSSCCIRFVNQQIPEIHIWLLLCIPIYNPSVILMRPQTCMKVIAWSFANEYT